MALIDNTPAVDAYTACHVEFVGLEEALNSRFIPVLYDRA